MLISVAELVVIVGIWRMRFWALQVGIVVFAFQAAVNALVVHLVAAVVYLLAVVYLGMKNDEFA